MMIVNAKQITFVGPHCLLSSDISGAIFRYRYHQFEKEIDRSTPMCFHVACSNRSHKVKAKTIAKLSIRNGNNSIFLLQLVSRHIKLIYCEDRYIVAISTHCTIKEKKKKKTETILQQTYAAIANTNLNCSSPSKFFFFFVYN